jgi:EAL domain-containing protein (putative c-di-GMP-specific phosphodiesterase class I)
MERAGLSRRLTEEVVRRAFSDHADYLKQLDLRLGLNFPLDTLIDGEMLQWLDEERQAFGIATDKITIELTESQPVADLKDADFKALGREIARLRDLGYAVALDDVSPEMKNHTSLFDFNFTSVKLDKELVFKSAYDPLAQLFVSETIALAQQAGFLVVAEGVRDPETWQRLRLAGADYAQGFMVARPLPAAAVPGWMGAWTVQR